MFEIKILNIILILNVKINRKVEIKEIINKN